MLGLMVMPFSFAMPISNWRLLGFSNAIASIGIIVVYQQYARGVSSNGTTIQSV